MGWVTSRIVEYKRDCLTAVGAPPVIMTVLAVGGGLATQDVQNKWAPVASLGFLVFPVLGAIYLLSALGMWRLSLRVVAVAATYLIVTFYLSAGCALYIGAVLLELLGRPVSL